jgi:hypothetical protein
MLAANEKLTRELFTFDRLAGPDVMRVFGVRAAAAAGSAMQAMRTVVQLRRRRGIGNTVGIGTVPPPA